MSDVDDNQGPPPPREKLVGSTTVACPMLNSTNYTVWSLRMKVVLRIHKAWSVIDPGTEKSEEKNNLAMGLLYQAIPESLIMQIGDVEEAKVLWEAIKARYVGANRVKEARLQTLNSDFDRLKMNETESIDSFAGKLSGLASKSASLGETIEETKLVKKLLKVVPRKFIHLVASLEQVLDLKSVGFEDVVGRLKAYEERIRGEDDGDGQQRVMFTRSSDGGGRFSGGGGSKIGRGDGGDGFCSTRWGRKEKAGDFNQKRSGSNCSRSFSAQKKGDWSNSAQFKFQPKNKPSLNSDQKQKKKRTIQNYLLSM